MFRELVFDVWAISQSFAMDRRITIVIMGGCGYVSVSVCVGAGGVCWSPYNV